MKIVTYLLAIFTLLCSFFSHATQKFAEPLTSVKTASANFLMLDAEAKPKSKLLADGVTRTAFSMFPEPAPGLVPFCRAQDSVGGYQLLQTAICTTALVYAKAIDDQANCSDGFIPVFNARDGTSNRWEATINPFGFAEAHPAACAARFGGGPSNVELRPGVIDLRDISEAAREQQIAQGTVGSIFVSDDYVPFRKSATGVEPVELANALSSFDFRLAVIPTRDDMFGELPPGITLMPSAKSKCAGLSWVTCNIGDRSATLAVKDFKITDSRGNNVKLNGTITLTWNTIDVDWQSDFSAVIDIDMRTNASLRIEAEAGVDIAALGDEGFQIAIFAAPVFPLVQLRLNFGPLLAIKADLEGKAIFEVNSIVDVRYAVPFIGTPIATRNNSSINGSGQLSGDSTITGSGKLALTPRLTIGSPGSSHYKEVFRVRAEAGIVLKAYTAPCLRLDRYFEADAYAQISAPRVSSWAALSAAIFVGQWTARRIDLMPTKQTPAVTIVPCAGSITPTANAGPDRAVAPSELVTINGQTTGTVPLVNSWTQISGSAIDLSAANNRVLNFRAPTSGTATLRLTVRDANNRVATDVVVIRVVPANSTLTLSGPSSAMASTVFEIMANSSAASAVRWRQVRGQAIFVVVGRTLRVTAPASAQTLEFAAEQTLSTGTIESRHSVEIFTATTGSNLPVLTSATANPAQGFPLPNFVEVTVRGRHLSDVTGMQLSDGLSTWDLGADRIASVATDVVIVKIITGTIAATWAIKLRDRLSRLSNVAFFTIGGSSGPPPPTSFVVPYFAPTHLRVGDFANLSVAVLAQNASMPVQATVDQSPPGLTFNALVFSGFPSQAGEFQTQLRLVDAAGRTGLATVTFIVGSAFAPPPAPCRINLSSANSPTINHSTQTHTVYFLSSNCAAADFSSISDWIQISQIADAFVVLNVSTNTTTQTRVGGVVLGDVNFLINQTAPPAVMPGCSVHGFSPSAGSITADEQVLEFIVNSSNCNTISAASPVSWLQVELGNPSRLRVRAYRNFDTETRSAEVNFEGARVRITQAGAAPTCVVNNISPSAFDVGAANQIIEFSISSSSCNGYDIGTAAPWLSLQSVNGSVIQYRIAENVALQPRTSEIRVNDRLIAVRQAGGVPPPSCNIVSVSPSNPEWTAAAQTVTFNFSNSGSNCVSPTVNNVPNWMSLNWINATAASFSVQQNTIELPRYAVIWIGNVSINPTQLGAPSIPAPLYITTTHLPGAIVGDNYSFRVVAVGGNGIHAWTAEQLPPGLSMSANGWIAGTPQSSGAYEVNLIVASAGGFNSRRVWLNVNYPPLRIANAVPRLRVGQYFSHQWAATGGDCGGNYQWQLVLPSSFHFNGGSNSWGDFYGSPVFVGSWRYTVIVRCGQDSYGRDDWIFVDP